jgi:hypothetical protein
MKRYLLTAEFIDNDFDLGWGGKRYWFKRNAIDAWWKESDNDCIRWLVIDTKTHSVVWPLGVTQETPRSP